MYVWKINSLIFRKWYVVLLLNLVKDCFFFSEYFLIISLKRYLQYIEELEHNPNNN